MTSKSKRSSIISTEERSFKERLESVVTQLYKEMGKKKERLEAGAELVSKILRNIIENPDDEKFRAIRRDNPKIKEKLTGFKSGIELVKLLGFQEVKDPATGEVIFKVNMSVSASFIKVTLHHLNWV